MNQKSSFPAWNNAQISIRNILQSFQDTNKQIIRIREESMSFFPKQQDSRSILNVFNFQNTLNFEDINRKNLGISEYQYQQQKSSEMEDEAQSNIQNQKVTKKRGLRLLARLVFDTMKKNNIHSHREVVSLIQRCFFQKNMSSRELERQVKNVRRRLYDALNVMTAAQILQKKINRLTIRNQITQPYQRYTLSNQKQLLLGKINERQKILKQKKQKLKKLKKVQQNLKKWMNKKRQKQINQNYKIYFPLIIIQSKFFNSIQLDIQENSQKIHIKSEEIMNIFADLEVIEMIQEKQQEQYEYKIQHTQIY